MSSNLRNRKRLLQSLIASGLLLLISGLQPVSAQREARARAAADEPIRVLPVRDNFYLLAGAGNHIAVQIGPQGAVLVNTGREPTAAAVLEAVRKLTAKPIRYIINTSADPEDVGGNAYLAAAGQPVGIPGSLAQTVAQLADVGAAPIIGTENVLRRMSDANVPFAAWPIESFFTKRKELFLNGEGIEVIAQPAAHTDGDAVVFFRRSDVLVTGNLYDTTRFPVIDVDKGGSIGGIIEALNELIEITIPAIPMVWEGGGTIVVPGRGRLAEEAELVEYRDMLSIIRDRVQALVNRGLTLEAIQAAEPANGYSAQYGADTGPWTTSMFIEAIYRSLDRSRQ